MEEELIKTLIDSLDYFLDHSDDIELYNEYIKMLKEKSAYTFLYVLNRISYSRKAELFDKTNVIIQKILIDKKCSIEDTSSSSKSEISSEEEPTSYRTGTIFDLLIDDE